jgi:hypothetical protein
MCLVRNETRCNDSQHQKTQDARTAFWALYNHYLGPSNVDHMATRAESKFMSPALELRKICRPARGSTHHPTGVQL